MKKGTFFTNLFLLISVCGMYAIVLFMGYMDISTYISIGTLTAVSLILFTSCFLGLNRISQITGCLKKFRKNILQLHVKDPEYVWETLREEKFVFKNSILDGEFNNFKKEMSRLEDEGAVYCQPDISDYVNENAIFTGVKKRVLDSVATIMALVGIAGILFSVAHMLGIFRYDNSTKVVVQCIKPIIVMALYILYLVGMYTYIYKILLTNMCHEYRLFIGDFYKYVVPCAKNDMANNIVYLQQIQMQNTEKLSENVVELLSEKINESMIRQSEKFTELSRQIECMTSALNRFNEGVDSLDITIKDMMENDRILSKEQMKVLRDCSEKIENTQVVVTKESKVEEAKSENTDVNKAEEVKTEEAKDDEVDSKNTDEDKAEEEKEVKKTTRKRATTAKKTTTKKTTAKKSTTATKKTAKKPTVRKTAEERIEAAAKAAAAAEEEGVVEVAPVKKKRGRKSKAEKEAELQAALEIAKKEMADRIQNEEKTAEEVAEEVKVEAEVATEEKSEETVEAEAATEEKSEEIVEAEAVTEEKPEETVEAEAVTEEKPEETVEVEAVTEEKPEETVEAEAVTEEKSEETVEETKVENENFGNVIAFRKEETTEDESILLEQEDKDIVEVVEVE